MTTGSEADAQIVARDIARLERMEQTLRYLKERWASIDVHMESDNGDVQLSVNNRGRLMSLSLAPGCTTRYTNEGLEQLITTTLRAAVAEVYAERAEIETDVQEVARSASELLGGQP